MTGVMLNVTLRHYLLRPLAIVLGAWVCSSAVVSYSWAQDEAAGPRPIQVKTDQILVPVVVFDKKGLDAIHHMNEFSFMSAVRAPDSHLLMDLAVTGLAADKFHIFEDGREQRIERVTPEAGWKQNLPYGPEFNPPASQPGRPGQEDVAPYLWIPLPRWPSYQVSYAPPPSAPGSCHTIKLKIDRRDSYVFARSQYCNTTHAVDDVLDGTPFGKHLAADLSKDSPGPIRLAARGISLFHSSGVPYEEIVLSGSALSRKPYPCAQIPEVGYLGLIYSSESKLAGRFSGRGLEGDFFATQNKMPVFVPTTGLSPCFVRGPGFYLVRRELPAGEYSLRAVFRDGSGYGRAEVTMHVKEADGTHLAISDVALGKNFRAVTPGTEPDPTSPDKRLPFVSKGYEILPIAASQFRARETLEFYFEVLAPQQSDDEKIQIRMRVMDMETRRVAKEILPADTTPYRLPGDPVIPVAGGIDMSDLKTGSYQLQVQATDAMGESTAWSAVAFTVQ